MHIIVVVMYIVPCMAGQQKYMHLTHGKILIFETITGEGSFSWANLNLEVQFHIML